MIRICAWCKKVMGVVEPATDGRVTHGICPTCLERAKADLARLTAQPPECSICRRRHGTEIIHACE